MHCWAFSYQHCVNCHTVSQSVFKCPPKALNFNQCFFTLHHAILPSALYCLPWKYCALTNGQAVLMPTLKSRGQWTSLHHLGSQNTKALNPPQTTWCQCFSSFGHLLIFQHEVKNQTHGFLQESERVQRNTKKQPCHAKQDLNTHLRFFPALSTYSLLDW